MGCLSFAIGVQMIAVGFGQTMNLPELNDQIKGGEQQAMSNFELILTDGVYMISLDEMNWVPLPQRPGFVKGPSVPGKLVEKSEIQIVLVSG